MGHHKKKHIISNTGTKKSAEQKWRHKQTAFLTRLATKSESTGSLKTGNDKPRGKQETRRTRRIKTVVSIYTALHQEKELATVNKESDDT